MRALALALVLFVQSAAAQRVASGVISGEIRSADGSPAVGVRVSALAAPESNASSAGGGTMIASLAQSDGAGRYRLEEIPAGRYFITAGLLDFPTYYPGVKSAADARAVTVGSGGVVAGVNFTLARPAGIRVSGRVTGVPAGAPAGLVRVTLLPTGGPAGSGPLDAPAEPDGAFEFLKVSPGAYNIRVTPSVAPITSVRIDVDDKDIRGIALTLPPMVLGRVTVDDGSKLPVQAAALAAGVPDPPSLVQLRTRRIETSAAAFAPASTSSASVRADGFFLLPVAAAGQYQIGLTMLPFGYYAKSISYGGADLLHAPLKFGDETSLSEIHVTLTTTPPASTPPGVRVSGRVVDLAPNGASQAKWVSMQLSISAANSPLGIAESRVGEAAIREDGTFEVLHVPPGAISVRTLPAAGAIKRLDVADRDVSGVELTASPPARGAIGAAEPSGVAILSTPPPPIVLAAVPPPPPGLTPPPSAAVRSVRVRGKIAGVQSRSGEAPESRTISLMQAGGSAQFSEPIRRMAHLIATNE